MQKRIRCPVAPANCHNEWVALPVAAPLVFLACFFVLIIPFFNSLGLSLAPGISFGGMHVSPESFVLGLVLLLSFLLGVFRRHEHEWFCIFDSLSIPGLLLGFIYVVKKSGLLEGS
jgi:hypothetical protein